MSVYTKMASILIIDDDKHIIQQLSTLITSFGHTPISSQYPTSLFQILETKSVDLILMDVNMPEIDGLKLLKQLKDHPTYKSIPVIMLTGDTGEKLLSECFEAGAVDFINKPFGKAILRSRIQSTLGIQEYIAQLRESKEQAEEATKLKDKFVALVAHDLKSPFTSILGLLTLVNNDKKNPLYHKHREMISRTIESGEALVKMIEELLKISRLQTGKIILQKRFFDAYYAAAYAETNLGNNASKKGIKLINKIPRDTRIYADFELFCEVIENLVSNAIKFCNKGDSITFSLPADSRATIAVSDTGIGINEKKKSIIFKHEVSTSTVGTAGEEGTGLGLPFSYEIMEAHSGSLRVESVEGEGCAFYAQLPDVKPQVLLVDDDKHVRLQFKVKMEQSKLNIMEAANGEEALMLLEKTVPHLILTDIKMPKMDGFEFLKRVKENIKTKSIPVIVFTGETGIHEREKAFQNGAVDFINKPFVFDDLIPRVRRFVG